MTWSVHGNYYSLLKAAQYLKQNANLLSQKHLDLWMKTEEKNIFEEAERQPGQNNLHKKQVVSLFPFFRSVQKLFWGQRKYIKYIYIV